MAFLHSFLRRHFAGKPVVASHVSCFLRPTSTRWYEGQARYYSLTWDVTFAAFLTLSIHESWMPSVAAKSSASPIWTPIVFISETTTCMIAKDELTMKLVILKTINNNVMMMIHCTLRALGNNNFTSLKRSSFKSVRSSWFTNYWRNIIHVWNNIFFPQISNLHIHRRKLFKIKMFHHDCWWFFCSLENVISVLGVSNKRKNHLPKHLWFGHNFIHFSVLPGGGGVSGFGGVGGRLVTGGCAPQYNKFACWMSFLLKPYLWPRLVRPFLPTMVLTPCRLAKAVEE